MVTDVSVIRGPEYGAGDRRWLRGRHGHDAPLNMPLDYAAFAATGLRDVQSGCLVGWITGQNAGGPYDPSATDGRQTPVGALLDGFRVPDDTDGRVATGAVLTHFQGDPEHFPHKGGPGGLDDAAKTALSGVVWFEGK